MSLSPTYVARLTPPGTGAIATIGLLGPQAWSLLQPLFQPATRNQVSSRNLVSIPVPEPTSFLYGRIGDDATDEVVLSADLHADPLRVEIHCHGGPAVIAWLIDLLKNRGAEEISWEIWLRQTQRSRLKAEASIALAQAPTLRTANVLLDQYAGALKEAVQKAIEALNGSLDQPDGKIEADKLLGEMIRWLPIGRHLTKPWRVVLLGAPNVGKSTLINAIVGYQRSITSPVPGTTRDVVTVLTAIDGWLVELADTAGLHAAAKGLESLGIERAKQAQAEADLCLWLLDGSQTPVFPDEPLAENVLPVINKVDQPAAWDFHHTPWPNTTVLQVSALTGTGIPALIQAIGKRLVPESPPAGTAVPFNDAIGEVFLSAKEALNIGDVNTATKLLHELME